MIESDVRREARKATEKFRQVEYLPQKVARVHKQNILNIQTARTLGLDYHVTGDEDMPLIPPGRVVFNFA